MLALFTVIPIILIRYLLMGVINKESLNRAAFSPPVVGIEKTAFWIYQITNSIMLLLLIFYFKFDINSKWFLSGLIIYFIGIITYAISTVNYAQPYDRGINHNGLYKISRNPMYVAYFICLLGCVLLTNSWILLVLLIFFQISVHFIILSEERWCIERFGEDYISYMEKVRRYF